MFPQPDLTPAACDSPTRRAGPLNLLPVLRGILRRWLLSGVALCAALGTVARAQSPLEFGIHRVDVTPELREGQPVWLAGYGWGRQATGVHDPLYATCVVLADGKQKLALVTIDVVGLQLPTVVQVRSQLTDFAYVLVSSTHNHEGPDTIGLWGKTPLQRGVDDKYLDRVVRDIVAGVRQAEQQRVPVRVGYGTASDESLLGDSRQPVVKDGVLRVLRFERVDGGDWAGLLVQWNCHPEAMGPRNTLITADFPAATIARLSERFRCPVAYFTGAVGGLLAPPDGIIKDEQGQLLREGDFEYARRYGEAVADLAARAAHDTQPLQLTPFRVAAQPVAIPVANSLYRTASLVGLLRRPWDTPLVDSPQPEAAARTSRELAVTTEVAYLRLGELSVACIPGELYPELVYGKFQEPVDPGADFPDAPLETPISALLPDARWLLLGLANDEIGYIIPKRQWDLKAPYAYGRNKPQYGEVNSCGPEVAPRVMQGLARCIEAGSQ